MAATSQLRGKSGRPTVGFNFKLEEKFMQKKLIALAVAGLVSVPAFAQSNVTIYGRMDVGVFNKDDANGNGVTRVDSSGWTTSRLGFKGSEDLGNGLKAIFQIETRLENDSSSTFGSARDTFVGLTGGFGTLIAGRNSTPLNNWLPEYDPSGVANAFRTSNVDLRGSLETRVNNSVVYAAPTFSGVEFAALYAPDEDDTVSEDIYGIGLQWKSGPIAAMFTWHAIDNTVDNFAVGFSYNFGVAKIHTNYIFNEFDASGTEDEQAWAIGVSAPIGAGSVGLGFTQQTDIAGIADNDIDVWALTYKHNLSKRTYAYAGYQYKDRENGSSQDTYGVGVAHHF